MAEINVNKTGLTPQQADIVAQTLPVVGANIEKITPNFYKRMFAAHPELIADTFNRGNQKQGAQQKALAASVATFASLLIDPNAPDPVDLLQRIGHKHISVGIKPDQYPIVHKHLFDAIEEILTPDVFQGVVRDAWDAVYLEMERVLIEFEKGLYSEMGVAPGDVFRAAHVIARDVFAADVVRFTVALDDVSHVTFQPGQYISVRQTMADGARQLRQYSLVNAPSQREETAGGNVAAHSAAELSFAVRRVDAAADLPAGEVSTQLFEKVQVGDAIEVSLPAGDLVLDETATNPVVLISAGIGATPMVGMLSALAANSSQRRVLSLHADRSEAEDALRADRESAIRQLENGSSKTWYESALMNLSEVELPADAEYYLCGGNGFLQAIRGQLNEAGVAPQHIHFELFSPNDWLLDA